MATGSHPFARATSFETLSSILNEEAPPVGADVPEPLAWIIERCLEKNPADRYGSTTDLARDLARLRDRSSTGIAAASRSRATSLRRGWWIAALVVALAAALFFMSRPRATTAEPMQAEIAIPELVDVMRMEVMSAVAISPDGRQLVVNGFDATGTSQLWLRDLRTGSSRLVAERAFAPAWSEDGSEIAFFAEGKLKRVPAAGGPPQVVCAAEPESTPWWEGDTILFGQYSQKRGLYRVKASGGQPELVIGPTLPPNLSLPFWPQLLPDEKHFLYVALQPDAEGRAEITRELKVGSFGDGETRVVGDIDSRAVAVDKWLLFVRDGTLMAQEFDPSDGLRGEARPVIDGLHYFRSTGLATFSVSRNGVLAWCAARPPSRLVWVDRSGMEIETIASAVFDANGRLSDDGKRYVVGMLDARDGVADVWVYDLERGSSQRATFSPVDEKAPVWARDGRTIYYRSDGGKGPPDIRILRPGTDRGTMLYAGPTVEEPKDVSPDGKWLLYASFFVTGSDILALPLEGGGEPRPIATTPFNETSPRFSPDGKWIAYSSDLSGRPEVYIRAVEGDEPGARLSRDGGTRPRWRPDGQELYYLGPEGRVMVVPITGSSFGSPRLLFQNAGAADFEPAPDGSRFLMQIQPRAIAPPVRLLVNWQARLR
jgi:Tol biopolymer transport system component